METKTVDINEIYLNDKKLREDLVQAELIQESIKTLGVRNPLIVIEKDGKYLLVDGFYRYKACKNLGITEVPIRIMKVIYG